MLASAGTRRSRALLAAVTAAAHDPVPAGPVTGPQAR